MEREDSANWQELGQIHLSFGYIIGDHGERRLTTRARHPAGDLETSWPGVARPEMLAWILDRAKSFLPQEETAAAPPQAPPVNEVAEDHPPLDLEFVDLHLTQIESGRGQCLRVSGRLRFYKHFGDDSGTRFRVEFVLANLDTGEARTMAVEQGDIHPDEWARQIERDFPIPSAGRYEVRAVVRTSPAGPVMAESRGPVLRVEP
jgi:hypothetical protein